jgi:hypothetical protein
VTANACNSIANVTVDGVSQGAVARLHLHQRPDARTRSRRTFSLNGPYSIAASAGSGGTITPSGSTSVACGATQAFAIAADPCKSIADVVVDGGSVGAVSGYTFTNVAG